MGFRNKDVIIDKGLNCGIQHIKEHCKDVQPIVICSSYTFLDIIERILKNALNKCLGLFREGLCKSLYKGIHRMYACCCENDSITFFWRMANTLRFLFSSEQIIGIK